MKITKLLLGSLPTNTYIIVDEQTNFGAVVDPAVCSDTLLSAVRESGMVLKYILLTHGHYDHILGAGELKSHYPDALIAIGKYDVGYLSDPTTLSYSEKEIKPMKADVEFADNDTFKLGSIDFKVMHTPGHTPGGVCYITENVIFSGDTLFCRTVGRTDYAGGSYDDIIKSVTRLGNLPGDYLVLPGHSDSTSLEAERHHNKYMRKIEWNQN